MVTSRSLPKVLDQAKRVGTLNLRTEDIAAALPHVGPQALRQALHRQQWRGADHSAFAGDGVLADCAAASNRRARVLQKLSCARAIAATRASN